jgi:excisionase family DNA binding protein
MEQLLYDVDGAAQVLGLSRSMVLKEIKAGAIEARLVGTKRMVTADALQRYVTALPKLGDAA